MTGQRLHDYVQLYMYSRRISKRANPMGPAFVTSRLNNKMSTPGDKDIGEKPKTKRKIYEYASEHLLIKYTPPAI